MSPRMSETAVEATNVVDKEFQVISWRREQLVRAGYAAADATALAFDNAVDLHAAVNLLRRGCPSATALRILL
jgi:hypothetical protein